MKRLESAELLGHDQGRVVREHAALSLSNPMTITYWAALGGTITAVGVEHPGWLAFAVFLAGFMTSSVLWCFFCAGLIAWTRRHVGPAAWTLINLSCAAGLAFVAALVVWRVANV